MQVGGFFGISGKAETEILTTVVAQIANRSVYEREDIEFNVDLMIEYMEKASASFPGYDLIVFPEDTFQGFTPGLYQKFGLTLEDELFKKLQAKCKELGVWGVFSPWLIHEGAENLLFDNSAILINDQGEIVLKYVKNYPFTPFESTYPGDGIPVVDGPKGSRIALLVCWDGDFPEAYREATYNGANVIIRTSDYIAPMQRRWEITNQSGAMANNVYVVACNACHVEESFQAFGDSMIVGPDGNIITRATEGMVGLIKADLYPGLIDFYKRQCGHLQTSLEFNNRGGACLGNHGKGADLSLYNAYKPKK